jgi:hypothetical protein
VYAPLVAVRHVEDGRQEAFRAPGWRGEMGRFFGHFRRVGRGW